MLHKLLCVTIKDDWTNQQVMSPSRSHGQESMASAFNIKGPQWQLPKFSAPAMTYQSYKLLLTGFLQLYDLDHVLETNPSREITPQQDRFVHAMLMQSLHLDLNEVTMKLINLLSSIRSRSGREAFD